MGAVLVCGGAGYVGSHTCKALAKAGFQPVAYDNLCAGHRELVKWGPLVEGDLLDGARIREAIRTHGCTAVIHFAGAVNVGESSTDPRKFVQNNVVASATLVDEKGEEIALSPPTGDAPLYSATLTLADSHRYKVLLVDGDGQPWVVDFGNA